MYLGQKLKSMLSQIMVKSNNPVLKFGRHGGGWGRLNFPRGIKIGKDNCLYVADAGNRLIQKFTPDGKFLSQFRVDVNGANFSIFDMVVDEDRELITSPEVQMNLLYDGDHESLDYKGYEESTEGDKILVFNLQGELKNAYTTHKMKLSENIIMNRHGDMIISDRKTNSFFKFDKQGKFICEMGNSEILNGPSYMCLQADGGIIFSDTGNNCIRICDSSGQLTHKIGATGQLFLPYGVATDGENIITVDHRNHIHVFKPDGTFVSMIESESDPLLGPRGLAVTRDGYVYVADRHHHCIKKYKYRDMSNQ